MDVASVLKARKGEAPLEDISFAYLVAAAMDARTLDDLVAVLHPVLRFADADWSEADSELLGRGMLAAARTSAAAAASGTDALDEAENDLVGLSAPITAGGRAQDALNRDPTLRWMANARNSVVELSDGMESNAARKERRRKEREQRIAANRARLDRMARAWRKVYPDYSGGSASLTRDVHIQHCDVSVAGRTLIADCSLSLVSGRRYGLVGFNGSGKTTLLRHISDRELNVPPHISILHVEQEVVGDDTPVLRSVLEVDVLRDRLMEELDALLASASAGSGERLTALYQRLEEIEADKAEALASQVLAGLGFTHAMQAMPTRMFSGGWRMRLALARALYCKPDLLLLDEPTNMLDMPAVVWLERYLRSWPGTLLIVSHDRDFLNEVSTDIIHLHGKRLQYYRGNYDAFDRVRTERLKQQSRESENRDRYVAHVSRFIDRFRYNAHRASLVQSRIKMLEKLEPVAALIEDPTLSFTWPDPVPLSPPIVRIDDLWFGYGLTEKDALSAQVATGVASTGLLFRKVNLALHMDSRVAVVGANGTGKSTLLHLITGEEKPSRGFVVRHARLRLGVFSQHHVEQLDLDKTAVEFLATRFPGRDGQYYRGVLGRYGIHGDTALQTLDTLSGGQKSRVVFAMMALEEPHLLVMDEPTNHLDIETVEALASALNSFTGGYILVTHDERLIRLVCDELWVVRDGTVTPFEGGSFDAYKASLNLK
jgi:ATP-binding cassette subfamily F protein 3